MNRQILLAETPKGKLGPEHFRLQEAAMPAPQDGEVLLKVKLISLDAANRAWMQGATYREAVGAGAVMAGGSISEVVELREGRSRVRRYRLAGICVAAREEVAQGAEYETDDASLERLWRRRPHRLFRAARRRQAERGRNGRRLRCGRLGRLAGWTDRQDQGLPLVGIAGGKEKCDWLKSELGFDEAVDYKSGPVFKSLKAACPDGIDVYFDNVGGEIFEACLSQMKLHGRIACCGAVSAYDGAPPAAGPRGVPGLIVVKRLRVEGFIVMDYYSQAMKAVAELQGWVAAGKLKVQEDILEGLENTPKALIGLLNGDNRGKRMVRLA
jgi:NADPH-dependent curcumin reductase CurA